MQARRMKYCKRITFGGVFFLAPLAITSLSQIKYIAKCEFKKTLKVDFNQPPNQIHAKERKIESPPHIVHA